MIETLLNPVFLSVGTAIGAVFASKIGSLSNQAVFANSVESSEQILSLLEKSKEIASQDETKKAEIDELIHTINRSTLEAVRDDFELLRFGPAAKPSSWSVYLMFQLRTNVWYLRVLQFVYFLLLSFLAYVTAFRLADEDGFLPADAAMMSASVALILIILLISNWVQRSKM